MTIRWSLTLPATSLSRTRAPTVTLTPVLCELPGPDTRNAEVVVSRGVSNRNSPCGPVLPLAASRHVVRSRGTLLQLDPDSGGGVPVLGDLSGEHVDRVGGDVHAGRGQGEREVPAGRRRGCRGRAGGARAAGPLRTAARSARLPGGRGGAVRVARIGRRLLNVRHAERREHGVRYLLHGSGQRLRVGRRGYPGERGGSGGHDGGEPGGQQAERAAPGGAARRLAGRAERGERRIAARELCGMAVRGQRHDETVEARFARHAHWSTLSIW